MLPYVEVLKFNADKSALAPFALVEPSECWFELSYYEIGECEVYAPATPTTLAALVKGNFLKIPNKDFIWFITGVQYEFNSDGARMVSAKGYEAKWLLKKRVILSPYQLPTELGEAVFRLVNISMGQGAASFRKVKNFIVLQNALGVQIESTQATRGELAEFVQNLLKASGCGSIVEYVNGSLVYRAFSGVDRSATVLFSQSLDNLISATYYTSDADVKTYCQIVSTFTQNNTSTDYVEEYDKGTTGIDRDEMTLQSNLSTKYTDESGVERETTPTSALYKGWQVAEGKNALAEKITVVEFNGEIDLAHSGYVFGVDFFVGDFVGVRDEYFGISEKARVTKYTFKQDAEGYGEEAEYGNE